jgi:hypothetical protein
MPPFTFSVGERKMMNHFVVKFILFFFDAALPREVPCGYFFPTCFAAG